MGRKPRRTSHCSRQTPTSNNHLGRPRHTTCAGGKTLPRPCKAEREGGRALDANLTANACHLPPSSTSQPLLHDARPLWRLACPWVGQVMSIKAHNCKDGEDAGLDEEEGLPHHCCSQPLLNMTANTTIKKRAPITGRVTFSTRYGRVAACGGQGAL